MVLLVIALQGEADSTLNLLEDKKELKIIGKSAFTGKLFGKDVAIILTGIGKVNAAIGTQAAIDYFKPKYVINFGTAGGIDDSVESCHYYIADKACQFDFDLRELDDVSLGYIQDYDCAFFNSNTLSYNGLEKRKLATADRFSQCIEDQNTILSINCSLRDMEGGAVAQTCTSNDIPFVLIKGITDVYGSGSTSEQFKENLQKVSQGFPAIIKKIIENE